MKSPKRWNWLWLCFLPLPLALFLLTVVIYAKKSGNIRDVLPLVRVGIIVVSIAIVSAVGYSTISLIRDHVTSVRDGEQRRWNVGAKIVLGLWLFVFFMIGATHADWELSSGAFYLTILAELVLGALFFSIYFAPFMLANSRKHPQESSIFIVNLFAGWTIVAWIISLVWALYNGEAKKPMVVTQAVSNEERLEKLYGLYEKGVITQEEFAQKKKELLGL